MRERQYDRWREFVLDGSERPKTLYEYHVTGRGNFPLDMLRYDRCWPATGDDAVKMVIEMHSANHAIWKEMRSIKLRSYSQPTVDRWSSFIWSVGEKAVVR